MAHIHALTEAADGISRELLFELLVRKSISDNNRKIMDDTMVDGDPIDIYGIRYIAAEIVWLLPTALRSRLGFRPSEHEWWKWLRIFLSEAGLIEDAKNHIGKIGGWNMDSASHARSAGVVLHLVFDLLEEGENAIRLAIQLNPSYSGAWQSLGRSLLSDPTRYKESEEALRKSLELDPQYARAWRNLGIVLSYQHRFEEAQRADQQAIDLDPDDSYSWYILGNTLCYLKRFEEAEVAYQKALTCIPETAYTHFGLARLYIMQLGRYEAGISQFIEGLTNYPEFSYVKNVIALHWEPILPIVVAKIAANELGADNLRSVLMDVLIEKAADGIKTIAFKALQALDETGQQIFEPLILALQALDDRSLLYRIAREKRELVLDVMKRIEGKTEKG